MPIVIYTKEQVMEKIRVRVNRFKTQSAAAEALGVTAPVLCNVLKGEVPPPPKLCEALGIERVKLYASGVQEKHRD